MGVTVIWRLQVEEAYYCSFYTSITTTTIITTITITTMTMTNINTTTTAPFSYPLCVTNTAVLSVVIQ